MSVGSATGGTLHCHRDETVHRCLGDLHHQCVAPRRHQLAEVHLRGVAVRRPDATVRQLLRVQRNAKDLLLRLQTERPEVVEVAVHRRVDVHV